jgi:hypothetical protein
LAYGLLIGFVLLAVPALLSEEFVDKAASVSILRADVGDVTEIDSVEVSAVTILANRVVAEENLKLRPLLGGGLGSHPVAYDKFSPFMPGFAEEIEGLNAQDASGLLLRLLSETGVLGTLFFLWALWYPAWRLLAVLRTTNQRALIAVGAATASSYAGLLLGFLVRYGAYFDICFWFIYAIVVGMSQTMLLMHLRSAHASALRA